MNSKETPSVCLDEFRYIERLDFGARHLDTKRRHRLLFMTDYRPMRRKSCQKASNLRFKTIYLIALFLLTFDYCKLLCNFL